MNIIIQTYNRSFRTFGSEIHKTKFCEGIMILFLLFIPFIGKSEMVCLSLAGCKIEIETGECKTCVHKEILLNREDYTDEQMKNQIKNQRNKKRNEVSFGLAHYGNVLLVVGRVLVIGMMEEIVMIRM